MRRVWTIAIAGGLLAGLLIGCGRPRDPIPPGAQVVHVVATASELRLDPATVRAGDVYLVLDEPLVGSFAFVVKSTADGTSGTFTDDDLERLAHGDTEGTGIQGLDSGGCDAGQDAEDRGRMGPCGNVMTVSVVVGKYAILGPSWTEQQTEASVDPTAGPAGFVPPSSMAVLEVVP